MGDWSSLRAAVRNAAKPPLIWWRDDDAVGETPELIRLLALSEATQAPVHIAVIPALLEPSLQPTLAGGTARVLVHGWRHENHAPPHEKKAEFRAHNQNAVKQAATGLARLQAAFGAQCDPVFVPPWNRFEPTFSAPLHAAGYRGLSLFGSDTADGPLKVVNTIVDPIYWRGHRGLADPGTLIEAAVQHLTHMPDEPLGLLTHHLVQDDDTWAFSKRFLSELLDAGAQLWGWETAA